MATSPTANYLGSRTPRDIAPLDPNSSVPNQGDLLYSTGSGVASLNVNIATNSASFVGVCAETTSPRPGPWVHFYRDGLFLLKRSAPGASFPLGSAVYVGADAQTVQTAANGTSIGIVAFDQTLNTIDSPLAQPAYVVVAIRPAL